LPLFSPSLDKSLVQQGYQVCAHIPDGVDIIFPVSIVQCEPVLIYYNITDTDQIGVGFFTPDLYSYSFLRLYFPVGVGYLDWICDIPAGYTFTAFCDFEQTFTVQPGSSSACLGDITTAYSYVSYLSTYFQSYTQHTHSGSFTTFQQ